MSQQRHVIKRQILELKIDRQADAYGFQSELSRIYRQRIVPLIERYCSELSEPNQIHRIDSLVIDVGAVDPEHLEQDLTARLETALRQALADQIRSADGENGSVETASNLELLTAFARTGSLPWWADTSQPALLNDSLDFLMDSAPDALHQLMRELAGEPRSLQRIIQTYSDASLARLAGLLNPVLNAATLAEFIAALAQQPGYPGRMRQSLWTNILRLSSLERQRYTSNAEFYRALLARLAAELGISYQTLAVNVQHLLPQGSSEPTDEYHTLAERLGQLQAHDSRLAELWAAFQALVPQNAASLQRDLLNRLNTIEAGTPEEAAALLDALRLLLRQWLVPLRDRAQFPALTDKLQGLLRQIERSVSDSQAASAQLAADILETLMPVGSVLNGLVEAPAEENEPLDLSFSDGDELYISNAGLVILWPFLERFFDRLELLEGRQFKDPAAMQRAVGMLQYLATGALDLPEYLLPLNKLLCGMELEAVFDLGQPLLPSEIEECDHLLAAAIEHAPILRKMSVDGLRGTFLLRQGALSSRDGTWLLRVERETYDVVLGRFPWNWEWVKLPWMDLPLWVEW